MLSEATNISVDFESSENLKNEVQQSNKTVKRKTKFFSKQNKFKKCKTNQETPTNNLTPDTKATTIEDSGGMKITRSKKGKSNQVKSKMNPKTILTKKTMKKIVKKTFKWKKGEFSNKPEFSERYLPIPPDIKTSYEYFKIFFPDELIELVVYPIIFTQYKALADL